MLRTPSPPAALRERYLGVRRRTEDLAAPLSPEDQQVQSMPSCSPVKWHRAHTTWFFETFVLGPAGVAPLRPEWAVLFNSYYEAAGPRHPRPERGVLSRPTCGEVAAWRAAVDGEVLSRLDRLDPAVLALGLAHEEQHQELILTDVLHAFSANPLRPAYDPSPARPVLLPAESRWVEHAGGLVEIGAPDDLPFAFDNERPRHRAWLEPFALASRPVSVREVRAFVAEGGYRTPSLWMSDGLDWVRARGIEAPGHARLEGGAYVVFDLHGERAAADDEPAAHLSWYEADAIARYLGARLPSEEEWEAAAPSPLPTPGWEWTRSAYGPYPGFAPAAGALGEYNGKFMANQVVLRGGSAFTPPGHARPAYRNFWPPDTRFQRTGVRLARSL